MCSGGRPSNSGRPWPSRTGPLAHRSRQALADARRLIRGYQRISLSAELATAVTLLSAAGIDSRVVVPDGDLPDTVGEPLRTALRADVGRLLHDDTARRCVIRVRRQGAELRLDVHAEFGAGAP